MIISPRTALPFNQQINDLLCRSVFRVKDKDGKLDGRLLEKYLFNYGKAYPIMFNGELMFFPIRIIMYGLDDKPAEIEVFNVAGTYTKVLKGEDIDPELIMYDFDTYITGANIVSDYEVKIAELQDTIDRNISAIKLAYVVKGGRNKKNPVALFFEKILKIGATPEEKLPVVVVDSAILNPDEDITFFNTTDRQKVIESLEQQKKNLRNECYRYFGIDSLDLFKKERLITDEINADNLSFSLILKTRKENRERSIERIRKVYGVDLTLECRIDPDSLESKDETQSPHENETEEQKEVEENE